MKISARTCKPEAPKETHEPDLEFYLEDSPSNIRLMVRDKISGLATENNILGMYKNSGKLERYMSINPKFGLPLNSVGQLKLTSEG